MTALVALTLGLLVASTADGQYDTLNPATVSDTHGNTADRYNNLTWAPLPSGVAYEDASAYDDKGLGAFMNLAKSFVNTVQKLDLDQLIGKCNPHYFTERKYSHCDYFVVFGSTWGCHNGNLRCRQRLQSSHEHYLTVSMFEPSEINR